MADGTLSPAEQAAQIALDRIYECIDQGRSFLLEAGAGAGKTYSLIKALIHLLEKRGTDLLRQHQQVACRQNLRHVATPAGKVNAVGQPALPADPLQFSAQGTLANQQQEF